MEYKLRGTGELVPQSKLAEKFPGTKFQEFPDASTQTQFGFDPIAIVAVPLADYQTITRGPDAQDKAGAWRQTWNISTWPQDKIDAYIAQPRSAPLTQAVKSFSKSIK